MGGELISRTEILPHFRTILKDYHQAFEIGQPILLNTATILLYMEKWMIFRVATPSPNAWNHGFWDFIVFAIFELI